MKTMTLPLSLARFSRLFPILFILLLCCFSGQLLAQLSWDEELIFHDISSYAEDLQLSPQQQQKLEKVTTEWKQEVSELANTYRENPEHGALYDELAIKYSLRMKNVLTTDQYGQFEQLFLDRQGRDLAISYNTQVPGLNMSPEQGVLLYQARFRADITDQEAYLLSILTDEQKTRYREYRENDLDSYADRQKEEMQMILVVFTAINQEYINKLREVRTRFNNYLDYTDQNQLDIMRRQRRDPLEPNFEQVRQELNGKNQRADILALGEALFEEFRYAFFQYPRDYQFMELLYENYTWDTLAAQQLVQKYQEPLVPFVPIIHEISREAKESITRQLEQHPGIQESPKFGDEVLEIFHLPEGELSDVFIETFLLMEPLELEDGPARSNQNPFGLEAYPSPARTTQTIEFELPVGGQVLLEVVDQRGQILKTLHRGRLPAGVHRMDTDVSTYPDGIHFYRLTHPNGISTVKFVVER